MSERGEESEGLNTLLSDALSNIPHGLALFNAEQRLILCNPAYVRLYRLPERLARRGAERREILDHCIESGFGPVETESFTSLARRANESGTSAMGVVRLVDGRIMKISHSPIEGGSYVSTHLDVTEATLLADELARAKASLEARVRERTALVWRQAETLETLLAHEREINDNQRQFLTMASHEFRTPLTIIDGAAQRLFRHRDRIDAEFIADKAQQIRASAGRLIDLMESILENGRHAAGLRQPVYDNIDLAELLRLCCERQLSFSRTHRFHLDVDQLPTTIDGDRPALEQVFTNLLCNAVKYSRHAPDIRIHAAVEEGIATIQVIDQGIGIDAEDLPRMFGRYFRARTSSGISGTGIGLHLVRQIVEMHQGVVEVASERGRGSTFTVRLPVVRPTAAPARTPPEAPIARHAA